MFLIEKTANSSVSLDVPILDWIGKHKGEFIVAISSHLFEASVYDWDKHFIIEHLV